MNSSDSYLVLTDEQVEAVAATDLGPISVPIDWFGSREARALRTLNIKTFADLACLTVERFLSVRSVGWKSLTGLREVLDEHLGSVVGATEVDASLLGPDWLLDLDSRKRILEATWAASPIQYAWFGPRESRALEHLKVETYADLASVTSSDFLRVRAVGRISLEAARASVRRLLAANTSQSPPDSGHVPVRTVEAHLTPSAAAALSDLDETLLRVSARDARFGDARAPDVSLREWISTPLGSRGEAAMFGAAISMGIERLHVAHVEPQSLMEELRDLVPLRGRREEMAHRRWGWVDGHPATLEETAKPFGVTRERIRQATDAVWRRYLRNRPCYLPTTAAAIRLVADHGGAVSFQEWGRLAVENELADHPDHVRAIPELMEIGIIEPETIVVRADHQGPVVAVSNGDFAEYGRIGAAVRKYVRRSGVVDLEAVARELREEGLTLDLSEVRDYAERMAGLTELGPGGLYVRLNDPTARLWEAIGAMLSVRDPLPLGALHRGIGKTRPGREEYSLTVSVVELEDIMERSSLVRRIEGNWSWASRPVDPHWSPSEMVLKEVLEREGPVVTAARLFEAADQAGFSRPTASNIMKGSLFLEKVARARYALLGSVSPEDAEELIADAQLADVDRQVRRRQELEEAMTSRLVETHVAVGDLYLDPNNPRFADLDTMIRPVSSDRVIEESVQDRALSRMLDERFEVQQLQSSIASIGFLTVDRLVVVELPQAGKYMVVEGNRRLAAIKTLLRDEAAGEVDLNPDQRETLTEIPVMVIDDPNPDARNYYARVLQGVRHVASVRPWGPYQQAQLVGLMLDEGRDIADIKEALGLSATRINSLRRVYYAREQMRRDPDFGDMAKPGLFSNFEEALKVPKVRAWLEWDDSTNKMLNTEHRQMLYGWFVGVEDDGERLPPKIVDAKDVRKLPGLMENPVAFQRFVEDPKLSLAEAARRAGQDQEDHVDWRSLIAGTLQTLANVPALDLVDAGDADLELLSKVKATVDVLVHQIAAAQKN